jgi:threonine dehydrogenase-like Zn-dependent dehydrogenase
MMHFMGKKDDEKAGKLDIAQGTAQPKYSETEKMKAVIYGGTHLMGGKPVKVGEHPKPLITHAKDVILKVELSAISGCDLHMMSGQLPTADKGQILGHEAVGTVHETGADVTKFKRGDRVVVALNVACGECRPCQREEFDACDATNDSRLFGEMYGGTRGPAAVLGYSRLLGGMPGCQAEFVRVPFADVNLYRVPPEVTSDRAIFASDIMASGLHAALMGKVTDGDIVAVWGLGPVGLLAGFWCRQKGAKRVIGIDHVPERLRLAQDHFGFETIDRTGKTSKDVVDQFHEMLPLARCSAGGADVVIEAAGFRFAQSSKSKMEHVLGMETESADILEEMAMCARKFGRLAIVGDYCDTATHFPIGHFVQKHLSVTSGFVPVQRYFPEVMNALKKGLVDPAVLVSQRVALEDAPVAYEKLAKYEDGFVKVILQNTLP